MCPVAAAETLPRTQPWRDQVDVAMQQRARQRGRASGAIATCEQRRSGVMHDAKGQPRSTDSAYLRTYSYAIVDAHARNGCNGLLNNLQ